MFEGSGIGESRATASGSALEVLAPLPPPPGEDSNATGVGRGAERVQILEAELQDMRTKAQSLESRLAGEVTALAAAEAEVRDLERTLDEVAKEADATIEGLTKDLAEVQRELKTQLQASEGV